MPASGEDNDARSAATGLGQRWRTGAPSIAAPPLTVDPGCRAAIRRGAEAVDRIVARGEPVYGINTGFGKLASVRIATGDLETLQRNIVLSHAAGVGETTPAPIVRLMMALKLASLAQGASGVRPETVAMLEAMLEQRLDPGRAGPGLGGCLGRPGPPGAHGRGDDRGERDPGRRATRAGRQGPCRGRPRAADAWPQGRAGAA